MQHQRRKVEFFTGGRIKGKMPEARLELAQGFNSPTDFKSGASADSATRALQKVLPLELFQKRRSQTGGAGRNRTAVYRFCRPMHYHFATAPCAAPKNHAEPYAIQAVTKNTYMVLKR